METIRQILDIAAQESAANPACRCNDVAPDQRGDSVLERDFWYQLDKTTVRWHGAIDQFQIGRYRVDCMIDCGGTSVVIELDGKAFHNALDDEVRDTELLKSVGAIVRVPYWAISRFPDATFKVLGTWFPRLQKRGSHIYAITKDEFTKEYHGQLEEGSHEAAYFLESVESGYQVYDINQNSATIGPASAFSGRSELFSRVWVQYGQNAPATLDRLYARLNCPKANSIRRSVA